MNTLFTIAAAYQWTTKNKGGEINNSEKAIKQIIDFTTKRFINKMHKNGCNPRQTITPAYNSTYKKLASDKKLIFLYR